jgi:hypothetical protein
MLVQKARMIGRRLIGVQGADYEITQQGRIPDSKKAVDFFLDQLPSCAGLGLESIVLVLDADRPAIYSEAGLHASGHTYFAQMRRYLDERARARGFHVIDLQPLFIARHRREGLRFEFPTDAHWNELGHRVVAEALEKSIVYVRVFGPAELEPIASASAAAAR